MFLAPDGGAKPVRSRNFSVVGAGSLEDWQEHLQPPKSEVVTGDARTTGLEANSVDLIVTSPPYWQKRDYGHSDQIGQESTPQAYVAAIMDCLHEWKRVLRPSGSIFLNVGDTYHKRSLVGIPGRIEAEAVDHGWLIRNRIIWTKDGGMPEPARNRLANRHEYIIHLTLKATYYYDLFGYSEALGSGANPGDVWNINPERNMGAHLAPYPQELVRRAIRLGCPPQVCSTCNKPRTRLIERTRQLDPERPQAKRAMELADAAGLTDDHIRAIQATGVSDVGKATKFQTGTGRNTAEVQRLAAEAKEALGGYFREFTFAKKVTTGWADCGHGTPARGVVLDPFMGTGTTLKAAVELGRDAIGVDLVPLMQETEVPRQPESLKKIVQRSVR
ncbi:DNA methyltransferase [Streptomyces sp. NPDC050485]|uniref:DNA-methyltransferase n=1 Tax=Streptomyces sp. NPDC050485 TaxID=3365617 RepID=UPI0037A65D92